MNSYYLQVLQTISDSLQSIDDSTYDKLVSECIQCIKENGKVIASGLGKNVPICEKFVGTLNSVGIPASFLHTNTAMHGDLGIIDQNDLVILLSKSGNTAETVALASQLKARGNIDKTWLLTFGKKTETEKIVPNTLRLELDSEGDKWNIVPNNSTTVFLIVLQGIAIELINRLDIPLEDFKRNHPGGAIGEALKTCKK